MPSSGVFVFPMKDEAGGAELGGQVGVIVLDPAGITEETHAFVHRVAGRVAGQVLEEERHPAEGSVGKRGVGGLRARLVEERVDHRVELGVELLDARDGGVGELGRRDLAVAHQPRLGGRIEQGKVVAHARHAMAAP